MSNQYASLCLEFVEVALFGFETVFYADCRHRCVAWKLGVGVFGVDFSGYFLLIRSFRVSSAGLRYRYAIRGFSSWRGFNANKDAPPRLWPDGSWAVTL